MIKSLPQGFKDYLLSYQEELQQLIFSLCTISAPSHDELEKATFCKNWLEQAGAQGVILDDAWNVIYPYGCAGKDGVVVFAAHTDTVFPKETPLAVTVDGDWAACPGIGDDSANVAILLMCARYVLQNKLETGDHGILFVCDSGEEGLGNLKGARKIMKTYGHAVKAYIAVDGSYPNLVDTAVGSTRYKLTLKTEGGHSYGAFGSRNAIQRLAAMIQKLYAVEVPRRGSSKTTYNVGVISGGTSVNTIAQEVSMLYEYRSDDEWCLEQMKRAFDQIVRETRGDCLDLQVEVLGQRPCGNTDPELQKGFSDHMLDVVASVTGERGKANSGSTDCNIPLSMGIPAVSLGGYKGKGTHTREEKIDLTSLVTGSQVVAAAICQYLK